MPLSAKSIGRERHYPTRGRRSASAAVISRYQFDASETKRVAGNVTIATAQTDRNDSGPGPASQSNMPFWDRLAKWSREAACRDTASLPFLVVMRQYRDYCVPFVSLARRSASTASSFFT